MCIYVHGKLLVCNRLKYIIYSEENLFYCNSRTNVSLMPVMNLFLNNLSQFSICYVNNKRYVLCK